jgi:hypothetical protein
MKMEKIPTTTRQAFKILDEKLSEKEKASALTKSRSEFACDEHFGLGMWIRNAWYYGIEDERLQQQMLAILLGEKTVQYYTDENGERHMVAFFHPDDLTTGFLERYHDHLKRTRK